MKVSVYCVGLTTAILCFTDLGAAQQVRAMTSSKANADATGNATAGSVVAGSSQEKAVREVQAVFDQYIDGWKRADVDALSKVYAADARVTGIWPDPTLTYPVQGWPEVRKELERVFDFTKGMGMAYSPRHVEIYGDVAILTSNWEWTDPDTTQSSSEEAKTLQERRALLRDEGFGKGQATFVFFHRDGRWVLVHEHASVLPQDKEMHVR